jgi:hypothetical protein
MAAVIAPEANVVRTPTCAVITAFQLESWLRSLPVQRSLGEARRNQLIAMAAGSPLGGLPADAGRAERLGRDDQGRRSAFRASARGLRAVRARKIAEGWSVASRCGPPARSGSSTVP